MKKFSFILLLFLFLASCHSKTYSITTKNEYTKEFLITELAEEYQENSIVVLEFEYDGNPIYYELYVNDKLIESIGNDNDSINYSITITRDIELEYKYNYTNTDPVNISFSNVLQAINDINIKDITNIKYMIYKTNNPNSINIQYTEVNVEDYEGIINYFKNLTLTKDEKYVALDGEISPYVEFVITANEEIKIHYSQRYYSYNSYYLKDNIYSYAENLLL